jgi:hypothetical protein
VLDVFNEPAFSPVLTDVTEDGIERTWQIISTFGDIPDVKDWRTKVDEVKRFRPASWTALSTLTLGAI